MRICNALIQMIEEYYSAPLPKERCMDLYLFIQAHIKQEPLPMQFLFEVIPLTSAFTHESNSLFNQLIGYIDNNTSHALSKNQKTILRIYLDSIHQ